MSRFGHIELDRDDWRRFQRGVRNSVDSELPKRLGQANKRAGQLVISRLSPRPDAGAVGTGAGAAVRASASRREVLLRVGGAHRSSAAPVMQWGRRPLVPFRNQGGRPNIRETVERHRSEIEGFWLDAVAQALRGSFDT